MPQSCVMVLPVVKAGVIPLDTAIVGDIAPYQSNLPVPLDAVPTTACVAVPPVPPELVPKIIGAFGDAEAGLPPDIVHVGEPLFLETAVLE
jgi:hypothetical protein